MLHNFASISLSADCVVAMAASADRTLSGNMLAGGSRQMAESLRIMQSSGATSKLAERLLFLGGWGVVSWTTVQWIAEAAVMDGLQMAEVNALSSVGNNGLYPANCRRDIISRFCKNMTLPKPQRIRAPMQARDGTIHWSEHSILDPTAVLESMYAKHRSHFASFIGKDLEGFWNSVRADDPKLITMSSSILSDPNWKSKAIPYTLHGDGAVFTKDKKDSLLTVSWKPLLSEASFGDGIIPTFAVVKTARCRDGGVETADVFFKYLVHFLNAAYYGRHASADPEGLPWPPDSAAAKLAGSPFIEGKYYLVCWGLLGDLDYICNEYGFPSFGSNRPCWFCGVDRFSDSASRMTDLSARAGWKDTLVPFIEGCCAAPTEHIIMKLDGVNRWHASGDWMHTADLGHLQYLLGSALSELIDDGPYVGSQAERCEQLFSDIAQKYRQVGSTSKLSSLSLSMFWDPHNWSCLSAKAKESQDLLFALGHLLLEMPSLSDRDAARRIAFRTFMDMYTIILDNGRFLTEEQSSRLLELCEEHLLYYNLLCNLAVDRGCLFYGIMPKCHYLWHIVALSLYMNPRFLWCYEEESFMGCMTKAARSCVAGTAMRLVGDKVMENFLLVLELSLRQR